MKRLFNRLDYAVGDIRPAGLFVAVLVANVLLFILVLLAWALASGNARFSIEAATDLARVDLPAGRSAFAWGKVPVDPASIDGLPAACAKPMLDIDRPLDGPIIMTAQRQPKTGLLSISLKGQKGSSIGALTCEDGREIQTGRFVRLVWDDAPQRDLTLRFMGHLTIGDVPPEGDPSPLLLRNGTITTEAISWPFGSSSVRREVKLYPGDSVKIFTGRGVGAGSREALSHGLLQITQGGPISLVAHADAREARVIRVGQDREAPNSIAPSFWDRIEAQREWALIILFGALLLNIFNALRSYRQELSDQSGGVSEK